MLTPFVCALLLTEILRFSPTDELINRPLNWPRLATAFLYCQWPGSGLSNSDELIYLHGICKPSNRLHDRGEGLLASF